MSVSQSHIINSLYWCLVFSYLFLYLFPFPFSSIPLLNYVAIPWEFCIQPLISGTAAYCFHVQPDWSSAASGSGDQLVRYIELASYAGFAVIVTIIWSVVDRRRRHYTFLFALLRILPSSPPDYC